MAKITCFEATELPYTPTLEQTGKDRFNVIYGAEKHIGLSYSEAAKELGLAIMHSLGCVGRLDNRDSN